MIHFKQYVRHSECTELLLASYEDEYDMFFKALHDLESEKLLHRLLVSEVGKGSYQR